MFNSLKKEREKRETTNNVRTNKEIISKSVSERTERLHRTDSGDSMWDILKKGTRQM